MGDFLNRAYKFKGYDWTELSELWGIPTDICGDRGRLDATIEFMENCLANPYTAKVAGEQLRQFLIALGKSEVNAGNYENAQIWRALANIKSNEKLLLYARGVLEHMWT